MQNSKYQFYAIIFDVAGNQVSSKNQASPLSITTVAQLTTSLTLDPSSNKTISINETFTIKATLGPTNVNNKNIIWSTSDSNIATLSTTTSTTSENITVTGKKAGTVTITATPADGQTSYSKSIIVTVYNPIPLLLSQISASNYGDYVNYPIDLGIKTSGNKLIDNTTPKADWRIFYSDDKYTYLIASDYIPTSKFPNGVFSGNNGKYNGWWTSVPNTTTPTAIYKDYFLFNGIYNVSSSKNNYKFISYLLNTSLWTSMVNSTYADACIGGPTLEMWVSSWNSKYVNDKIYFGVNSTGYTIGKSTSSLNSAELYIVDSNGYSNTLFFPHNKKNSQNAWNDCGGYWVASPSSLGDNYLFVIHTLRGSLISDLYNDSFNDNGVRPVVCLKSTVRASKDVNEVWQLNN